MALITSKILVFYHFNTSSGKFEEVTFKREDKGKFIFCALLMKEHYTCEFSLPYLTLLEHLDQEAILP